MTAPPSDPSRRRFVGTMAAAGALASLPGCALTPRENSRIADLIVRNARITTLDPRKPEASAIAIANGVVVAIGDEASVMQKAASDTRVIDAGGRRMIPGLNDSHTHLIRGGLSYNMELRWDGVRSLADGMAMLKAQVARTPAPQWVRVVGGFTQTQFKEKRLPTLDELNAVAPDTPVFILRLYDRALLNRAALKAIGYDKNTPNPPGSEIQHDRNGNPTGLLMAKPNAAILYAALGAGPKLPEEYQLNSTRHFMRELNRLGITSVIDAGGGNQNYPDDYNVIQKLHADNQMTVRVAYNLFTQHAGKELQDFETWTETVKPMQGDDMLRHNGAGEMLVFSAADFELFSEPRPDLPGTMEEQLEPVVRLLAEKRWPFRIHSTYDQSIERVLNVYEKVNQEVPFNGLHWIVDHAETISARNIDRVKALGGGIAVQHRMAYQGEDFVAQYGAEAAKHTPPIKRMLAAGVPVGAGTDATRVASYNPWVALYWMTTGKTFSGLQLYGEDNQLERDEALRLWTQGSAWFSTEENQKGILSVGQLGDFSLLSADYMTVQDEEILNITSLLTVVGGKVVHGDDSFKDLAPVLPAPMPDWSPVRQFGGYQGATLAQAMAVLNAAHGHAHAHDGACKVHGHGHAAHHHAPVSDYQGFWGALGCSCFAF